MVCLIDGAKEHLCYRLVLDEGHERNLGSDAHYFKFD
jgi:hypothetical protein